jgi:hypothetical protein
MINLIMRNSRQTMRTSSKSSLYWIIVVVELILVGIVTRDVGAVDNATFQTNVRGASQPQTSPTLIPTVTAAQPVTATSEDRVLPPVGSNAMLVMGASLLVLIIILGVVFSSRRNLKH